MGSCFSQPADANQVDRDTTSGQPKTSNNAEHRSNIGRNSSGNTQNAHLSDGNPVPDALRPTSKPLHIISWSSKQKLWTRSIIDKERRDFFDTRLAFGGKEHIWQAIRQAMEVLWEGGDAMDQDGGLATAETLLLSAGLVIPKGNICKGIYDESGYKYVIPREIISDPENLAPDTETQQSLPTVAANGQLPENQHDEVNDHGEDGEALTLEEILRRKVAKGKGRVVDVVMVKARRNDGQADIVVESDKTENVAVLKERLTQAGHVQLPSYVRLFLNGSELDNSKPLEHQHRAIEWKQGIMITALVVSPQPAVDGGDI
ncbi:hypothetical protein BJ878DRAFT_511961 [Calycina marina]|uniref:DC-UbP/UBTD2 N-terminal domain-containing protein n=1 Tax=Calycina marina TaxID=1763456 RepID=A0A9P8CE20_9HELO|nr:hypothetical protein BJ878DRAFT_511961 [Calycina marina]